MKKIILTTVIASAVLFANAQLKVYSGGKVYVGGTATTPNSLLSVGGAGATNIAAYIYRSTVSSSSTGLKAEMPTPTAGGNYYGLIGSVPNAAANTYGVAGSSYTATTSSGVAMGVYGLAGNASNGYNYGVYGLLLGSRNGAAVYGSTNGTMNLSGFFAGYFDGATYMKGAVTMEGQVLTTDDTPQKPNPGSWTGTSDVRLKTAITPFTDGINVLKQINPIRYKFNGIGNLPANDFYIGVRAQDIQSIPSIAPYCVDTTKLTVNQSDAANFTVVQNIPAVADSSGPGIAKSVVEVLTFNYDALIYVLINSVKEMDSTITDLKNEIAVLKGGGQRTNESGTGKTESIYQIDLASLPLGEGQGGAILYQNEPNPFNNSTIIRYFVPENISGNVYISFADMYGKEINKLEIKERGKGKIEASTENLAGGIYSYSIVVNEKVIDTKKMLKNK